MNDNTTTFTDAELAKLEALRDRYHEEGAKERVWNRLVSQFFDAERWKRENTRCRKCRVKTYDEDLAFGLCAACIHDYQEAGRWCEYHGDLPVHTRWIDRERYQFEIEPLPCPICPLLGVA